MCAHALLSLFRSCREITNSSAKMIFDGSIELPTCITWQKYFDAITNRAVLLQVAPLHRSQDGGTYLRRSVRKRERIFFRQLYIISVFVAWPYGCDTFDFILIFGFSRHKKWVSCYSVRNGGLIITLYMSSFLTFMFTERFIRAVVYRWTTKWLCGYIGWENKQPLPACVYHSIRRKYNTNV